MPRKKPAETWAKSESKALLRSGLLSGEITAAMTPAEVYALHPTVHEKWKKKNYSNWCSNLRTLRNAIARDRDRMAHDISIYAHDIAIVKSNRDPNELVWHRTNAPKLLAQDIAEEKHLLMKPELLYLSRDEYQCFPMAVFRSHIYQELAKEPKRAIRFEKKKKSWLYPELHQDHPRLRDNEEEES